MSIQEKLNEMKELMDSYAVDIDKFDNKNNKAAGVRIRKMLQELKVKAQDARIYANEIIKTPKNKKE